jgi:hypothetical protein
MQIRLTIQRKKIHLVYCIIYCTWTWYLYLHFIYYYNNYNVLEYLRIFYSWHEYFKKMLIIQHALKLLLYYINKKYFKNLENMMKILNLCFFLNPMNILWDFFSSQCIINWIKCMGAWMICYRRFTKKRKGKQRSY